MNAADVTDNLPAPESYTPNTNVTQTGGFLSVRPSRFNARTVAADGTLLLYNSYTGAFSGLPATVRLRAEALLQQSGARVEASGLAKYMLDRGFLVPESTNELNRVRALFGNQHYRPDILHFTLLPSEQCNFRCVYCSESFSRETMEPWVRNAIVAMVERRIGTLRFIRIEWYGGEPLLGLEAIRDLSPRLQDLSKTNGVKFGAHMTTNGYLLTPDVLAELIGYGIDSFQISLDGSPEDHDRKRILRGGGPTFDRIYDNLKAARSVSAEFRITIRVNFDYDNLHQVDKFLEMVKADFHDDARFELWFHPVIPWGGPHDKDLKVCGGSSYPLERELSKKATLMALKPMARLPDMQGLRGGRVCPAARPYSFLIGADGKIMKCTLPLDHADYNILGHLRPDGEADIDVDKYAKWIAPWFEDDETCKACFYLPVCQGCRCQNVRFTPGQRPCPEEKLHIAATLNSFWEERQQSPRQYRIKEAEAGTI